MFALVVLAALLLAAAAMSWYARAALVDEREFSARAAAALDDSDVRRALAGRLVGVATRSVAPDALAVRPVLVPAAAALADTPAFRRLFVRALAQRHRALRDGETRFAFELPVGEGVVFDTIERFAPRAGRGDPARSARAGAAPRSAGGRAGGRPRAGRLLGLALAAAARRAPGGHAGAALLAGGTRAALGALGTDPVRRRPGSRRPPWPAWASSWWPTPRMRRTWPTLASAGDRARSLERAVLRSAHGRPAGRALRRRGGRGRGTGTAADRPGRRGGAGSAARATSPAPAARLARAGGLIALGALLVLEPALAGRLVLIADGAGRCGARDLPAAEPRGARAGRRSHRPA